MDLEKFRGFFAQDSTKDQKGLMKGDILRDQGAVSWVGLGKMAVKVFNNEQASLWVASLNEAIP